MKETNRKWKITRSGKTQEMKKKTQEMEKRPQEMEKNRKWKKSHEMKKNTGNAAKEEFLRRTDEAAAWEEKFDLLGEHYRRYL